ncbi:mitochondrial uncoupling protein 2-like [Contarinia nasturtii]|uniref:mitochondrial uncoupling protein 2-like n=1 Tax=Contarinia nasturtii TaxID=265458 RepID=UPI0012D3FF1F|nr:mitochondrial uncoupling protein 2-like [Contarinia nasturtii]
MENKNNNVVKQLLIAGTAASIADAATFPFDTAKVRLQLQGESTSNRITGTNNEKNLLKIQSKRPLTTASSNAFRTPGRRFISISLPIPTHEIPVKIDKVQYRGLFGTIGTIAKQEGLRSLYNGLSAGLQRQMVFASVRLGMYDTVKTTYQKLFNENPDGLHVMTRVLAGLTTGGLAVCLGQPTEVVKIKFQAQKRLPGTKLLYTSTPATYRKIGREEGVKGLWKGAMPNIGRNAVVNVSEIVCYDIVKECLIVYGDMRDNIFCHFTAAVIAGFAATVAASPIDVVKTRYMNSSQGHYNGAIDCALRMAKQEGLTAFYKGFVPAFARLVSWNICLWISFEQIKKIVYNNNINNEH